MRPGGSAPVGVSSIAPSHIFLLVKPLPLDMTASLDVPISGVERNYHPVGVAPG